MRSSIKALRTVFFKQTFISETVRSHDLVLIIRYEYCW